MRHRTWLHGRAFDTPQCAAWPKQEYHSKTGQESKRISHVPHELHEEFPEAVEKIHDLKGNNAHFATLADRYHTINRSIHRMESGVEPVADETLEDQKKQRLLLKDEIFQMLQDA